jgi:hypothetical protein
MAHLSASSSQFIPEYDSQGSLSEAATMINSRLCRTVMMFAPLLWLFSQLSYAASPGPASIGRASIGFLDGTESMAAVGWAIAPDRLSEAVDVDLYVDGPLGIGTSIGRVTADRPSPDLSEGGMPGSHRFRLLIPPVLRDARSHNLYAYAVETDGSRTPIGGTPKKFTFACSVLVCTTIRVAADGLLMVRAIGKPEMVYDHASDGCEDDLPDVPPRAFRDSAGEVQFISSQITAYRMSGPTLDNLRAPDCKPIMKSLENPDPSAESYHEWIGAVYTSDGNDVYALVHNEWYPSLVDHHCDPEFDWRFRINSITLAVSPDGGRSFHHPASYKLFRPGSPWKESYSCNGKRDDAVYGPAEPSNIVKSGRYHYIMFHQGVDPALSNQWGVCLARTLDINRAGSWSLWTSRGWVDGLRNLCEPISKANIGDMHSSITYNTYLEKYLLVGSKRFPFDGIYLSTSDDLIHWGNAIKILPMNDSKIQQGEVRYPVLLDPADTSRNFENTGRRPYLYLVLQHDDVNSIDVIRQQIMLKTPISKQ